MTVREVELYEKLLEARKSIEQKCKTVLKDFDYKGYCSFGVLYLDGSFEKDYKVQFVFAGWFGDSLAPFKYPDSDLFLYFNLNKGAFTLPLPHIRMSSEKYGKWGDKKEFEDMLETLKDKLNKETLLLRFYFKKLKEEYDECLAQKKK